MSGKIKVHPTSGDFCLRAETNVKAHKNMLLKEEIPINCNKFRENHVQ